MSPTDLSLLLKNLREANGMTRCEVAENVKEILPWAKMDGAKISHWESGRYIDRHAIFFSALEGAGATINVRKSRVTIAPGTYER